MNDLIETIVEKAPRKLPQVGDLILPYTKTLPIITYDQSDEHNHDLFIRAKFSKNLDVWYSECEANPNKTAKLTLAAVPGMIIFVPRVLQAGELVRIVKLFGATSGSGVILSLPTDFATPFERELANTIKT